MGPKLAMGALCATLSLRFRICQRKQGSMGSEGRETAHSNPQSANPHSAQSLAIGAREARLKLLESARG
eukprot:15135955-Alexandrium_andersonii.AAC.1